MLIFKQSESVAGRRDVFMPMIDSDDHVSYKTGLTLTVRICKAGATSFSTIAGTSGECTFDAAGMGVYVVHLAAADLDTLGQCILWVTSAGADAQSIPVEVVACDVFDAAGLGLSRVDVEVGTRALEAGGNVALIKAKTDNLPSNPADEMGRIYRALGLSLENFVEDDMERDEQGRKTGSNLYLYDTAAHAELHDKVTGIVAVYHEYVHYGLGGLDLYRSTRTV